MTIETRIEGESEGWDGETILKLENGQIWQQDEYYYRYRYKYRPRVTITGSSGYQKMRIEGIDRAVRVRRID